jgi:TRAP-type C4-dicarboxylate transport system permease small subunit
VAEPSDAPGPAVAPASFPLIRRIDAAWFRVEQAVCGGMFLAMAIMAFLSVAKTTFGNRYDDWYIPVAAFGIALLGVRTRAVKDGERRLSWPIGVAIAAAIAGALFLALKLYIEWDVDSVRIQKLTLVMMIWVALLGASMATYDRSHLALEMGEKLWPRSLLRYVKAIAHGVTSGFCVLCLLVSIHLVQSQADQGLKIEANRWLETWQAFLVMPYTFAAMAVRFAAQAVTTVTGTEAPPEERLPT